MRTIIDADTTRLAKSAAIAIIDKLEELSKLKKNIVLGLVGGRSVVETYVEMAKINSEAWKKTHFFIVDERVVPLDSDESNFKMINNTLLKPLLERKQIIEDNIHPIQTDNVEKSLEEYSILFKKYGGVFDVAVLSSGHDNHVAAIFPGHEYDATKEFVYIDDSPKPPKNRITATPRVISESLNGFIFFIGEEKKEALKNFLNNNSNISIDTQKRILNLTIITDLKIKG